MEAPLRRRSTLENEITAVLLVGITPPLPMLLILRLALLDGIGPRVRQRHELGFLAVGIGTGASRCAA